MTLDPLADDRPSVGAHWVTSEFCLLDPRRGTCITSLTVSGVGTWVVAGAGQVRFTPVHGYRGTASVTYQAVDSAREMVRSTLSVRVSPASATATATSPGPTGTGADVGAGARPPDRAAASPLATTGVAIAEYAALGVALLLLGAALLVLGPAMLPAGGRRRRRRDVPTRTLGKSGN